MHASHTPGALDRGARFAATFSAVIASMAMCAQAEDLTVFKLVARDGVFEPLKIERP